MSEELIKKSDAIKAITDISKNYTGKGKRDYHPHIDFLVDALKYDVPTVEPIKWIPCNERLPKDEGIFLVTMETYVFNEYSYPVGTSFYSPSFGWLNASLNKVLAWMPLPESYDSAEMKGADDE